MKAILHRAKALLYAPAQQAALLVPVLEKQGLAVRVLNHADLNMTLRELERGDLSPAADPAAEAEQAFLVLCSCTNAQMNKTLQALKAPNLPQLPLKAALTPTNAGWTARKLLEEIRAEHEKLTAGSAE